MAEPAEARKPCIQNLPMRKTLTLVCVLCFLSFTVAQQHTSLYTLHQLPSAYPSSVIAMFWARDKGTIFVDNIHTKRMTKFDIRYARNQFRLHAQEDYPAQDILPFVNYGVQHFTNLFILVTRNRVIIYNDNMVQLQSWNVTGISRHFNFSACFGCTCHTIQHLSPSINKHYTSA